MITRKWPRSPNYPLVSPPPPPVPSFTFLHCHVGKGGLFQRAKLYARKSGEQFGLKSVVRERARGWPYGRERSGRLAWVYLNSVSADQRGSRHFLRRRRLRIHVFVVENRRFSDRVPLSPSPSLAVFPPGKRSVPSLGESARGVGETRNSARLDVAEGRGCSLLRGRSVPSACERARTRGLERTAHHSAGSSGIGSSVSLSESRRSAVNDR